MRTGITITVVLIVLWAIGAYIAMPEFWKRYVRRHPSLADIPNITHTGDGLPGDPLNVSLIGTQHDVIRALLAAKWFPADRLSLKSSLEIAEASVLRRPYEHAPVSNLYLFGRKEDLAFEQPVGNNPRQRHHVRFWKTDKLDGDGRPVWIGAAIYDAHIGLSHETGEITHHTAPDIDAERDHLFADLQKGGDLIEQYVVDDFHKIREGKNGGGDPWHTDGKLYVGVTKPEYRPRNGAEQSSSGLRELPCEREYCRVIASRTRALHTILSSHERKLHYDRTTPPGRRQRSRLPHVGQAARRGL